MKEKTERSSICRWRRQGRWSPASSISSVIERIYTLFTFLLAIFPSAPWDVLHCLQVRQCGDEDDISSLRNIYNPPLMGMLSTRNRKLATYSVMYVCSFPGNVFSGQVWISMQSISKQWISAIISTCRAVQAPERRPRAPVVASFIILYKHKSPLAVAVVHGTAFLSHLPPLQLAGPRQGTIKHLWSDSM